ncbi:hypothetical protein RND81_09G012000 [Saponaria officinalis]|uniref:Uncharacterized protein n=1 Tax=Saponaria officinalis TaxID=3572 RepID=A0AAW1IGV7_SAPOF
MAYKNHRISWMTLLVSLVIVLRLLVDNGDAGRVYPNFSVDKFRFDNNYDLLKEFGYANAKEIIRLHGRRSLLEGEAKDIDRLIPGGPEGQHH